MSDVLAVHELVVTVASPRGRVNAVDAVSFEVGAGSALGIVGESGSGKTLTLRAVMALTPPNVRVEAGTVALDGVDLPQRGRGARRARRGTIGMVFQDPLSALDPVQTVGAQVAEVPRIVAGASRRAAWRRAVELLALVGIPDAAARAHAYPHQLSGGLRQRVGIAIAIAGDPRVLLCDEPTTALDVTVQAQILELIDRLRAELGLAVVFVSHDLAVVREICTELAVMYAGRIVEMGPTQRLLDRPAHPYTLGLLAAALDLDAAGPPPQPIPGSLPDVANRPGGCPFHPRCTFATADCTTTRPALEPVDSGAGLVACFHSDLVLAASR